MDQYEIINHGDIERKGNQVDLFSSHNWAEVLSREYNFQIQNFVVNENNASIPFAVVKNLKGRLVISLPFSDYICSPGIQQHDYINFVNYTKNKYSGLPIIIKTTLSNDVSLGENIRNAVYHTIDLKSEINQSSAFVRGVRKAVSNGLTVQHENSICGLRKFYKLYANLRIKKFRSIPQPFSFFKNIYDVFIDNNQGEIITVSNNNKVLAAVIVLFSGNTLYYKFGASNILELDMRPNNLLFDYLITYSKDKNFNAINLGLSGLSDAYTGLRRFKESMGGTQNTISYFRIDPDGYDCSHENRVGFLLKKYTNDIVKDVSDIDRVSRISKYIYNNFA